MNVYIIFNSRFLSSNVSPIYLDKNTYIFEIIENQSKIVLTAPIDNAVQKSNQRCEIKRKLKAKFNMKCQCPIDSTYVF